MRDAEAKGPIRGPEPAVPQDRTLWKSQPMSRTGAFVLILGVLLLLGAATLVYLTNTVSPPQEEVERTVPDDQIPK